MTRYSDKDTQQVTVRLEKDLLDALGKVGADLQLDRTGVIRYVLEKYVNTGKTASEQAILDRLTNIEDCLTELVKNSEKRDSVIESLVTTVGNLTALPRKSDK